MKYNFWTKKENVITEAKKYKTKKDFYQNSISAYYAALKLGIINDFIWFQKKTDYNQKDCVYAYIFEELKYVYVGRTLLERIKQRDKEHFSKNKNEVTYRFIIEHNIEKVPMKILEQNITVKEGIEKEKYWAKFYKKLGYQLINSRPCGGVGSLNYSMWDKNTVEIESKKYKSRTEFYEKCSPAYRSAIKHQWINELTWLKNERKVKRGHWTYENLKKEANKYENKQELLRHNKSAYVTAHKKGILDSLFNEKPTK